MFTFTRGISDHFVDRLNAEFDRHEWWHKIATDSALFVAIRNGYLNVYWKGNSLLKLSLRGDQLIGSTHYKYLLKPSEKNPYIDVIGEMALPADRRFFLQEYSDITPLKRAADAYAGDEKTGVHQIILSNENIIDAEVAFSGDSNEEDDSSNRRIDFAALRGTEIVFYEAKLFSNKELRTNGANPPVLRQIEAYEKILHRHRSEVIRSYRTVIGNLTSLKGVRDRYNALDKMRYLSAESIELSVNDKVRLILFGFDADQRDGPIWKAHHKKLQEALNERLLLRGTANGFTRGISL